jgi:Undecaprenyl-phosphate glucose phosphotransferase
MLLGPVVFAVELLLVIGTGILAGIVYHELVLRERGDIQSFFAIGAVAFFYYSIIFAYRGNYSIANLHSPWRQAREVTVVWGMVCLFLLGIAFLLKIGPNFSRGATISFFVLAWLVLVGWRCGLVRYLAGAFAHGGAFAQQRVLVLGEPQMLASSTYIDCLRRYGYGVAKSIAIADAGAAEAVGEAVRAAREDSSISGIFLVTSWQQGERIGEIMRGLSVIPLSVKLLPDSTVAEFLDKPVVRIGSLWAAELQRGPLTVSERCAKRIFDLVTAAAALLLLSPLLLVVGLLIKCDSRGPVLFTQTRTGFNSRPFRIFKFRTLSTIEDGPVIRQVSRNDDRLTRLGRLFRQTSIDELPQLMNVLRGEMSLIGPRPHAAAHSTEYEQLIGNYAFRHHVKPGLTGWAQVNGFRGETTLDLMQRRVDLDLWYIDNWSMWLDIKILARSVFLMFGQPTAY